MFKFFLSKNIAGTILVFLVFTAGAFYLFQGLSGKSEYKEQGIFYIEGIKDTVEIFRDDFGVPHIISKNEPDMYLIQGYTHAQDRLWQMDLTRRIADGRLSEVMGKDVLEYDKLFRTLGIGKTAEKIYLKLPQSTKDILKYYSKGVNLFIRNNIKKMPLEFDILDYKPEEWKPEDCVSVIRMMGWELNISWYAEFNFINIINKFGVEKAKDFLPDNHPDAPYVVKNRNSDESSYYYDIPKNKNSAPETVLNDTGKSLAIFKVKKHIFEITGKNYNNYFDSALCNFTETAIKFRSDFGLKGLRSGSNAWVINGSKTESKKPILANDPHIPLMVPSRWYEVVMEDKSRKFFLSGFSVPGVPGVLIGSNNSISWGITALMNDETDYFFLNKGNKEEIQLDSIIENISVKGNQEEHSHIIYTTKYGPVISGLSLTGFNLRQNVASSPDFLIVYRWTGFEQSDEAGAIYKINNAGDWGEFKEGLVDIGVPALNFVYADTSGNIGYKAAGKIPIRRYSGDEEVIMGLSPGKGNLSWNGFIPFNELPQSFNPSSGFIVTANNKPQKDYDYFISYLFEPHYRAARIEELLKERNNFTGEEIKLVQTDVINLMAKEFCNYLFKAASILEMDSLIKSKPLVVTLTEEEKTILLSLKKWDYNYKTVSTAASLFARFEIQLYKNLYKEKLGEELFRNYLTLGSVPVRNTSKLFRENFLNAAFDEFKESTGKGIIGPYDEYDFENLRDVLLKSFKDAIPELQKKFNTPDVSKWKWGTVHKVIFNHPLGIIPALSPILNAGPYESDGAGETIFNTEYNYFDAIETSEFNSALGSSLRFIVDMGDRHSYLSIIPPGQNGQNISGNYRNQVRLWLNGEYKRVQTSLGIFSAYGMKRMIFIKL